MNIIILADMPPAVHILPALPSSKSKVASIAVDLGRRVRSARQSRGWTLADLAARARVSSSAVHDVETGRLGSIATYVRLAEALGLDPAFDLVSRRRSSAAPPEDPVHAAMTDALADHLRRIGMTVAIDEPYQHYQFAGRADLIAYDLRDRALLHTEQRTRLPNVQEAAGSFNAKRAYLADSLATRLGVAGGFRSVTHVLVLLWSSEITHVLRMRTATCRALAPGGADPFEAWWRGQPRTGHWTGLVIFDPLPGKRTDRRRWIDLDACLRTRPRYVGYAAALDALRRADRA